MSSNADIPSEPTLHLQELATAVKHYFVLRHYSASQWNSGRDPGQEFEARLDAAWNRLQLLADAALQKKERT